MPAIRLMRDAEQHETAALQDRRIERQRDIEVVLIRRGI
jgi:hypothetical protein